MADSTGGVEGAKARLSQLKVTALAASVVAFGGLTATIAQEVAGIPVSSAAASQAPAPAPTTLTNADDSAPQPAAAPADAGPPPIVTAQS